MTYIDDNFGEWDIRDQDDLDFYHSVQAESVWKTCGDCGSRVKLRPHYGICNSCADRAERGMD